MVPIVLQYKGNWRSGPAICLHIIALRTDPDDGLTCLFNLLYRSVIGSALVRFTGTRPRRQTRGLTKPYEITGLESDDQV
jgi:hypothetical protein